MTKSTPFFVFIAIFLCQFACKSDDDVDTTPNIEFSNCLATAVINPTFFTPFLCDSTIITDPPNAVCDYLTSDIPFVLSEEDKAWLPYYCLGIGDAIHYSNESGDEATLVISDKDYSELNFGFNKNYCDPDSLDQYKSHCFIRETATISLVSSVLGLELDLRLSPFVDALKDETIQTGTQISITSFKSTPENLFEFKTHFFALVDRGNLEDDSISRFVNFSPEFTVLNQTFNDVYSYESNLSGVIPMLYNKEYGIISFIDKSGERWVINK